MDRARTVFSPRFWKATGTAASLGIFILALWLLHRALEKYELADIARRLVETPPDSVLLALGAAAVSYLALGGFDWLAIRHLRRRVPARLIFLASFISHGISHSAGFAALTGGAIRYRIYTAAGLTPVEVGAVIVFCGLTFVLGAGLLAATALITGPAKFSALTQIPEDGLRWVGMAILAAMALYGLAGVLRRGRINLWGHSITLPGPRIAALQTAVATVDLTFAAACLYLLLPAAAPPLWTFVGIYVLANLAGLLAHVPGGLGVFETAVVLMLPEIPADATLGALVLFRAIYNLLPLVLGVLLMLVYEAVGRRWRDGRGWASIRGLEPAGLAVLVFGVGTMLLFTGATPDLPEQLETARRSLALPVMQAAHLLAAGIGAGLMLVARGVFRRLANAHVAAQLLLGLGACMTMLRGYDWEESAICGAVMLALLVSRSNFYRSRSVLDLGYNPSWIGAGTSILIATGWLTLIAFRRAAEPMDFAAIGLTELDGAARALRALIAAITVYLAILGLSMPRGSKALLRPQGIADWRRAAAIVRMGTVARGCRVLRGDVEIMFSADERSFLMYRRLARLWVTLGEPIGPEDRWPDLAWAFREACEEAGMMPGFLWVAHRPLYLDLGLGFSPMGEEGSVDLTLPLSLDRTYRGYTATGDPGLSVTCVESSVRVKTRLSGEIVAEAALWHGADGTEAALGELQLSPGAPIGTDTFIAGEAMRWARERGFTSFNLGLAAGNVRNPMDKAVIRRLAEVTGRNWIERESAGHEIRWHRLYAALPADIALAGLATELSRPSGG